MFFLVQFVCFNDIFSVSPPPFPVQLNPLQFFPPSVLQLLFSGVHWWILFLLLFSLCNHSCLRFVPEFSLGTALWQCQPKQTLCGSWLEMMKVSSFWASFFSSPELKAQVSFSDRLLSVIHLSICKLFTISFYSQESLGQFQPKLAQIILGWRGFNFFLNKGPCPFPRGGGGGKK